MQKVTLPIVCILLLLWMPCSVDASKITKQDRGADSSRIFDGEENGSSKGQRQKIHHEKLVDGDHNDNSPANRTEGAASFQSQADVPLQSPYSPQGGGSGTYRRIDRN